jgi:hypothetical protein
MMALTVWRQIHGRLVDVGWKERLFHEGISMRTVYAKELVNEFTVDTQAALRDAHARYLDATLPADLCTNPELSTADRMAHGFFQAVSESGAVYRTDKDCISFLVAVTGLTELQCAAFILSESQPWHQQWPATDAQMLSSENKD